MKSPRSSGAPPSSSLCPPFARCGAWLDWVGRFVKGEGPGRRGAGVVGLARYAGLSDMRCICPRGCGARGRRLPRHLRQRTLPPASVRCQARCCDQLGWAEKTSDSYLTACLPFP